MALTIDYDTNFASFDHLGEYGLKAYMEYYQDTFSSSGHASSLGFYDGPGADLDIGGTTYYETYGGYGTTDIIGNHLTSTSTTVDNVSFVVQGNAVNLENGSGVGYSSNDMIYTGTETPAHVLAGEIGSLTFGDGSFNDGADMLSGGNLFGISGTGLSSLSNGFTDSDNDGYADGISSSSDVGDLIYDLMGGMGGSGSTSELESILNANDITHNGTSANDTFDAFNGVDTFVVDNGADGDDADVINAGFQTGSGGDIIKITGTNDFGGSEAAAVASVDYAYNGTNWDATLTYNGSGSGDSIEILGVANNSLTAANFDIA